MTEKKEPDITRTNIFAGEFSPTGVQSADCMRRVYLGKILGLKRRSSTLPLIFGSAIHKAVETFYGFAGKGASLPEVSMAAVNAFSEYWSEYGEGEDSKHSMLFGVKTMMDYCSLYYRDLDNFNPVDIESEQWCAMPNGTMLLVKMDRVFKQNGNVVLVDTKTTGSALTPYFWNGFENQLQVTLYHYVLHELLGRCDSIQIDAIKKPPVKPGAKEGGFARQSFLRTELQSSDAVNSYCRQTDYIMGGLMLPECEQASYYYCNQSCCGDYGGCDFLEICKHGLAHPVVACEFENKDPLAKLEIEGEPCPYCNGSLHKVLDGRYCKQCGEVPPTPLDQPLPEGIDQAIDLFREDEMGI